MTFTKHLELNAAIITFLICKEIGRSALLPQRILIFLKLNDCISGTKEFSPKCPK
jgi:hypothetical protein